MEQPIKLFLIEEYNLQRSNLKRFLENDARFMVIGEASSAMDGVKRVIIMEPDMVLTGISLPDFDGIEATAQIKAARPEIKVIVLTRYVEQEYLIAFFEAGGSGYVHKSATEAELIMAIDKVLKGEAYIRDEGVQVLAGDYQTKCLPKFGEKQNEPSPDVLSMRERQVLAAIAHGYSSREIAGKLFLSFHTVETYKKRILEKLGLKKKSELVAYAIKYRIFQDS